MSISSYSGDAAGRIFFCHHLTPDLVWRDEWRQHANGTVGVAGAVIAAEDPASVAGLFRTLFGTEMVRARLGPRPWRCPRR